MLREFLLVTQISILAAAFPLAVIAAWGYRDAPFGAALKPLPVVALAFLAEGALTLLAPASTAGDFARLVVGSVGLIGIAWAAIQLVSLLTGRRRL